MLRQFVGRRTPPESGTNEAFVVHRVDPETRNPKLQTRDLQGRDRDRRLRRAARGLPLSIRIIALFKATQGQVLSQSPTDATRFWWYLYGS
jgi:hypothetical protein